MRLSTKLSGIVALGGAAALAAGLISSGGIGAVFTDQVAANANINVGNLDCSIATTDPTVVTSGNTITVNLGTIASSLPGQKTTPVSVTNDGDMAMYVSWDVATFGQFFRSNWEHTYYPAAQNKKIAQAASRTYTVGAKWGELVNADMGTQGLVKYTATCSDQPTTLWFSDNAGGTHEWVNGQLKLTVPSASTAAFGGAAVHIVQAEGASLPATAPKFTQTFTPAPAGALRLSMLLDNGHSVIVNSDGTLDNSTGYTWGDALYDNPGAHVVSASLVADTSMSAGFTTTIECINFSGTALFGTC